MNKVKVLLIEANAEMEMAIPPNVAILVSAVKSAGFDVDIFSTSEYKQGSMTGDEVRVNTLQVPPAIPSEISIKLKKSKMIFDFLRKVKSYKPDIVGLSTTEATYALGLKLLDSIKDSDIFTIVGGAYSTLCPEDVIAEDSVDAVCIGEGAEALVELCQSMLSNKKNYNIKNIWFKTDSEVVKNAARPLSNIDDTPFQDWSPWSVPPRASKAMAGEIRTTALIELSRGCPFNCSFCANHYLNQTFRHNYRERSIDCFIEEIKHLHSEYNLGFIYIADETILTTSQKRFSELIDKYAAVRLPFWCQTRPEFITYEKVRALKEVGLQAINIGIESGDYEFRRKILNRSISNDAIVNGIMEAKRADVRVGANVIIGFPDESRENIFKTIELVREVNSTSTMVHLFQPYARTPLREECIKKGLIEEGHKCGDYRFDAIGTGVLSAAELRGLQRTFSLYVDASKYRWGEIEEAEHFNTKGNAKFAKLARKYQLKHFGRTSFLEKKSIFR